MFLYAALMALVSLIAGILISAFSKKADNIVYGKLDQVGAFTNVALIPVYFFISLFYIALSMFTAPEYNGFLGVLGWIVCIIIASTPLFCGLGLGFSVYLRKKGKSKKSFIAQFAGIAASLLSIILFILFYGNLLSPLN